MVPDDTQWESFLNEGGFGPTERQIAQNRATDTSVGGKAHDLFHERIANFGKHRDAFHALENSMELDDIKKANNHASEASYYLTQAINYSRLHHALTGLHLVDPELRLQSMSPGIPKTGSTGCSLCETLPETD